MNISNLNVLSTVGPVSQDNRMCVYIMIINRNCYIYISPDRDGVRSFRDPDVCDRISDLSSAMLRDVNILSHFDTFVKSGSEINV